jgi:hypothetical protein
MSVQEHTPLIIGESDSRISLYRTKIWAIFGLIPAHSRLVVKKMLHAVKIRK